MADMQPTPVATDNNPVFTVDANAVAQQAPETGDLSANLQNHPVIGEILNNLVGQNTKPNLDGLIQQIKAKGYPEDQADELATRINQLKGTAQQNYAVKNLPAGNKPGSSNTDIGINSAPPKLVPMKTNQYSNPNKPSRVFSMPPTIEKAVNDFVEKSKEQ